MLRGLNIFFPSVITAVTMEPVITRDGSVTLHHPEYDESFHSMGGAMYEANVLYVKGCEILQKAKRQCQISILDIGFGLGYNVFVAIQAIREATPACQITVVSFEKDAAVFGFSNYPEGLKSMAAEIKSSWVQGEMSIYYKDRTTELIIYRCDARSGIQQISGEFDAVFHDPFSTRKNPELWTVDFFRELKKRMKPTGLLATYSVATPVIVGLKEAGLYPMVVPGTGAKRYALIASREKRGDLSEKFSRKLTTSPERWPFKDPTLSLSREEILSSQKESKLI